MQRPRSEWNFWKKTPFSRIFRVYTTIARKLEEVSSRGKRQSVAPLPLPATKLVACRYLYWLPSTMGLSAAKKSRKMSFSVNFAIFRVYTTIARKLEEVSSRGKRQSVAPLPLPATKLVACRYLYWLPSTMGLSAAKKSRKMSFSVIFAIFRVYTTIARKLEEIKNI